MMAWIQMVFKETQWLILEQLHYSSIFDSSNMKQPYISYIYYLP